MKIYSIKKRYIRFLFVFTFILCCSIRSVAQDAIDTISVISFNDFHGMFLPDKNVPGGAALVGTVNAIRNKNPHPIVVSGGDNFSGAYFSRYTRASLLPLMFQRMHVELSAVGNHEFDWGLPYLTDTLAVNVPLVAANIENDEKRTPSWVKPYHIVETTLRDGKPFRIAFIGLATITSAYKNKAENLKGVHFTYPVGAVEEQMLGNLKKESNIDMAIIVMHIGTDMKEPYRINEKNAEQLPFIPGISAIVSAHSHEVVLDKINNVPVIQAGCYSNHVGLLRFQIRNHNGLRDISYIDGDTISTQPNAIDLVMKKAIDKEANSRGFYDIITIAKDNMIHDANINYDTYTAPGAYISASYAYSYKKIHPQDICPIVGANHFRGIRTSIYKGPLTYIHAADVLPFGGDVIAYEFTGKTLAKLLTDGRNGKMGYLQTANITMQLNAKNEVIRIWQNGHLIQPDEKCIVVVDSYIASGGDFYDKALFTRPIDKIGATTDLFIKYLRTQPSISQREAPLPIIKR